MQMQASQAQVPQIQAFQTMNTMPPLPISSVPPPAPPPPDNPPPPLPHENNQPLFGNNCKPAPVPPPTQTQQTNNTGYSNTNVIGHAQNWSQPVVTSAGQNSLPASSQPAIVNADALKKLAEEQKAFDIQFQKWEEEIEKWKKDNVNHPDKQAYKEYEQKFEACRAQLMERQQQMKEKRARLLGHTTQAASLLNAPQVVNPPPVTGDSKVPTNKPTFQNANNSSYNQSNAPHSQQSNYNSNQSVSKQNNQQYAQYKENKSYQNIKQNADPQDVYDSYHEDYSSSTAEKSTFLSASGSTKGIPGLDLVPDSEKPAASNQDIIDITEEQTGKLRQTVGPDLITISKGISNILGDEKIMNMLNMVRNVQTGLVANNVLNANMLLGPPPLIPSGPPPLIPSGPPPPNPINQNIANNFSIPPPNNQWDGRSDNSYNSQYGNRQNTSFDRQDASPYPVKQQLAQNRMYVEQLQDVHQEQFYERNNQYGGPNMQPRGGSSNLRPNVPPGRRPLQDMSAQQNMNDHRKGPHEDNVVMNQPPRHKWVEEPLFTPSIIVEYEHKPLRLKGN